jgi:hypothetical protein
MTIKTYLAIYRNESGKELYTKLWYATSWEFAFHMANVYMNNKCDGTFDFILQVQ